MPSYRVGLDVTVALEFRTSRTNGVLLAVSNQANDGLSLEIVQGKVHNKEHLEVRSKVFCVSFSPCTLCLSHVPSSCSSMLIMEQDESQQSTCLRARDSVTASGTPSLPTSSVTGWSWWSTGSRAEQRVLIHAPTPVTPMTPSMLEGFLV